MMAKMSLGKETPLERLERLKGLAFTDWQALLGTPLTDMAAQDRAQQRYVEASAKYWTARANAGLEEV